eukprot:2285520-Prymnesium_polylepis.2
MAGSLPRIVLKSTIHTAFTAERTRDSAELTSRAWYLPSAAQLVARVKEPAWHGSAAAAALGQ